MHQRDAPFVCKQYYSRLLSIRRGGGDEASLNTEYTDGTKPKGDTEFLKEHGNLQRQTPKCNSKFKVQNSKL
ncbi:hypothetical protein HMPREF0973_01489 [Prevotella veroralis F0319]|uniref:Uncharacterized protein n=1 Tax=Prevotella veroralis F0319 TaxID=649761 RepID=C9MPE9_9BACT|nr:hypothetical protein HMPREF0973_01489 [Prevotella veroralis F0319]